MVVGRDGVHPGCPSAPSLGFGPSTIGFQYFVEPDDPRSNLNIHKRDMRPHEKRPMGMCRLDQLIECIAKFLCIRDLLLLFLLLQHPIEVRDDISIDLYPVSHRYVSSQVGFMLTWSAHSRECARSFASVGKSGVPRFKSSSYSKCLAQG